ncbi:MAG: sugar transferase [Beijerinckiaceae bacterium]|nr:sugar transferase [Beijerinckiaceae bacterium]
MIEFVFWLLVAAIVYHHLVYPALLRIVARGIRLFKRRANEAAAGGPLPDMTIVMSAYNEAPFIAKKIEDLAAATYAGGQVTIVIGCDGSCDGTADVAQAAIDRLDACPHRFELRRFAYNRGKVAVINELIEDCRTPLVALTDISAAVPCDALERVARHFNAPDVGVVCPGYELLSEGSLGEGKYWRWQSEIRRNEAVLGSPMGAHGAFYAFLRDAWEPLAPDTINDDFVLPMAIVANGYRAVYAPGIRIVEREKTQISQEFMRRIRIGAGNVQQAVRLRRLARLDRPGLAFTFVSGKGLRAFMPLILLGALVSNAVLAVTAGGFYTTMLVGQILGYTLAAISPFLLEAKIGGPLVQRPIAWIAYLVRGYLAGLIGMVRPSLARRSFRSEAASTADPDDYIHPLTFIGKRAVDIVVSLAVLVVLGIILVPIAILIKLDSPGPVFYRQIRVGRRTSKQTDLFYITKFRTMRTDAEKSTGAVWSKGTRDPRITRLGHFLRKTRIDELPQALNVLRGDMSIVGPRPERPAFFPKLEAEIPYYAERTYSIKPGITGLAQVNHGYDASIEDVRTKVLYDHTYAMLIAKPLGWLKTDFGIIVKTLTVMATGKGQ